MAFTQKGLPVLFTGRVGDIVGYQLNGKYYIRKRPRRSGKKPTAQQLQQRVKFMLIVQFLKSLKPLFTVMEPRSHWITPWLGRIRAYNYRYAIVGTETGFQIDYAKVMLSFGSLRGQVIETIGSPGPGRLLLTWQGRSGTWGMHGKDRMFAMVYCPLLRRWSFSLGVNTRSDGSCTLNIPEFSGKTIHVWTSFAAKEGGWVSDSLYAGEIVLKEGEGSCPNGADLDR